MQNVLFSIFPLTVFSFARSLQGCWSLFQLHLGKGDESHHRVLSEHLVEFHIAQGYLGSALKMSWHLSPTFVCNQGLNQNPTTTKPIPYTELPLPQLFPVFLNKIKISFLKWPPSPFYGLIPLCYSPLIYTQLQLLCSVSPCSHPPPSSLQLLLPLHIFPEVFPPPPPEHKVHRGQLEATH